MHYISANIKEFIEQKGLSISAFARTTGINKATLSRWFSEEITPSTEMLARIANAYGVSISDFTDREPNMEPVFDCAAGDGRINGAPAEIIKKKKDWDSTIRIHGDSMFPVLCDGDLVRVKHMPETTPHDLTVVKVDGETATIKYVEVTDTGIWLRAENKDVFEDKFFTVQEILSLPVTIIGKAVELKRTL